MENRSSGLVSPSLAREQLRAARDAQDSSVRRATLPAGFILASSVLCGAQTIVPAYKGPGDVVGLVAVAWFLVELLRMSARNQWRSLRSLPKPRWSVIEVLLICIAVFAGGVLGPHLLASRSSSPLASWSLGAAVTVIVASCLFAAQASYRRRAYRGC